MSELRNSQEDELKRRRTSIKGKIKRREATIEELQFDMWRLQSELRVVEISLREYRK